MLKTVHLKNLALIEEAEIDFEKGLNIMTGETGSGKSVIIGSVNLALGQKANKSMIRTGASYALAELVFTNSDERVYKLLDSLGISYDTEDIIISRKITPQSSSARINGESVTLSNLNKLSSLLVDIHGQHEHQSLLNPAKHMEILDSFGAEKIREIKEELCAELSVYKKLRSKFKEYDLDETALEREISLLDYENEEIENAALSPGEDEKLEKKFKACVRARKTYESLSKIKFIFSDETNGILTALQNALKEIDAALKEDANLISFKDTLADMDSLAKDFSRDITSHIESAEFDEKTFAELTQRLNIINTLKGKYGESIDEILNYQFQVISRLNQLKNFEEYKEQLSGRLAQSKAKINTLAKELSAARKETALILEPMIIENLKDLNFLSCEFKIDFQTASKISAEGFDKVQFLISLNPGQPLKPLSSVASGGELSRIMLALKSALAGHDNIETLIFDEIDTGISGQTASKVAEKLKTLSRNHQIICITHLAQIAAKADSHFLIEKKVEDEKTISGIRLLDKEDSVRELAKMISGNEVTPAALEHARQLKGTSQIK